MNEVKLWADLNNLEGGRFTIGVREGDPDLVKNGVLHVANVAISDSWAGTSKQLYQDAELVRYNHGVRTSVTLFGILFKGGYYNDI